ncbi:MAG: universal stress protein [archaeon]|nr:universal stress protein [archaeon]
MAILVAYDGKEQTKKALNYAIEESILRKTKVYVFSAIVSKDQLDADEELEVVNRYMDEAKAIGEEKGADLQTVISAGVPWKGILEAAERFECDMIVVGRAQNKSAFDRVVIGSVSDAVVRDAKCVVTIVQ